MNSWISQLDENSQKFAQAFGGMTQAELNWKPNPEQWSIGQNIDHLITINETYFPIIEQLKAGSYQIPFHGRFRFIANKMGDIVLKASSPDRSKKIKTFPIWEPSESDIPKDILKKFVNQQERLMVMTEEAQPFIDQQVIIASPANTRIIYTLARAFDIIVAHEKRHFNQSMEVQELLPYFLK